MTTILPHLPHLVAFLSLFGDILIYLAFPILTLTILLDFLRDDSIDSATNLQASSWDYSEPPVSTYLTTNARIERRQGSRQHR